MSTTSTATGRDFTTTITVEQTPEEVYAAVLDVRAWWTGEIEGSADRVGDTFTYVHPPHHHTVQRVVELEPARRVVWEVTESRMTSLADPEEWTGSRIVIDIVPVAGGTELRFTHVGLVPEVECYEGCSIGWTHYVAGSLRSLITTGRGLPDPW
jgi:Activator of Hsp90 ATPase homolog 1-like protein